MTNFHGSTVATSANDRFKQQYNRTLSWSGLVAALLTLVMAWLSPSYTPHPYRLPDDALHLKRVEIIYEPIEPPAVAAPPVIPPVIEETDDLDPDAIDPIDIGDNWDILAPPPPVTVPSDDGFVASSAKPVLLTQAKPHYPEVARLAQVEGTVVVRVLVNVDGVVEAAEIVRSVHPLLDRAALKAARQCTFIAGQQREVKVPTWVAVPYNFRLN